MKILNRSISPQHRPYVIAEMSGNHNQSLERALALVEAAAKTGVDAIKLQTYTAATMTLDSRMPGFVIEDEGSLWNGRQLYELYEEAHTPWEWHRPIIEHATRLGMHCFSTPFDATAVDFLEELNVPAYKIASFEITDLPLIQKIAATGKPIIISTGMATADEIVQAVSCARQAGCHDLVLLKCTSTYPASASNTNILTIPDLKQTFGCEVGLSDHTLGIGVAVASVALGATVIEKHFTLNRAQGGVDSAFSMEPQEMSQLVLETERAWQGLGQVSYGPTAAEQKSLQFRRSLFVVCDLPAGSTLTYEHVRSLRPCLGLAPKFLDQVIGKKLTRDVKLGTALQWELLA